MNSLISTFENFSLWHVVGFVGIGCFIMRWAIQIWFSKKMGVSTFPIHFWYFSITGSLLLIVYFYFGNRDIIGILANFFALVISIFNLSLRIRESDSNGASTSKININ
ncbi:MAG: lipid-A-disaccharide synthase N-terminal domain-containing protein [Verrucomicrobia bacterium]|nr:lipid-A-disaccharide synthase N-terminal domain-containing protein [Verrucomicrobiota bacterium]MDA1068899.1 lipid-A-disaccharide synthase N-terminal domain-containing protein [Verrucomicrobiota bacterium]